MKKRVSFGEKLFDVLLIIFMILLCVTMLYPFLYALAYSLSDGTSAMSKMVTIIPIDFTLENFRSVLKSHSIINSFIITISRTVIGVVYAIMVTGLASYAISKRNIPGNRVIAIFLIIPMYISGGLIPYYVLIHDLHLFNNFLVYILPAGLSAYHMLIMRTYFESIPPSMEESARLDGAGEWTILFRIIFPLSKPILATIAIFVGVRQWNQWFDTLLFVTKPTLFPLQSVLQRMLLQADLADLRVQAQIIGQQAVWAESLKMATLIITTLPILFIYPFLQKYFIKGVMIGAVKA